MTTQPDQIPARRMGHFVRTPEFHRTIPLLILGPNLPNAACKNKGNLWDDTIPGETDEQRAQRHHKATTICHKCPEQTRCLTTRQTNPLLGGGIWGGQDFGKPAQRLCACGCGQPLPPDAATTTTNAANAHTSPTPKQKPPTSNAAPPETAHATHAGKRRRHEHPHTAAHPGRRTPRLTSRPTGGRIVSR